MINVTQRMDEILTDLPYPHCEAPMRRQLSGVYVTWEVAEQSAVFASGRPIIDLAKVNIGVWLPPTTPWNDAAQAVIDCLAAHKVHGRIDGSDWYPEVQRNAIVITCTLSEDLRK